MKTGRILSWVALVIGWAIILASFFIWGKDVEPGKFAVNIVVSLLCYVLAFLDFLFPFVDLKDKAQKRIGTMSVRMVTVWSYIFLAVVTMLVFTSKLDIPFLAYLIMHCVYALILVLGFMAVAEVASKVSDVYEQESAAKEGTDGLKRKARKVMYAKEDVASLPAQIAKRTNEVLELVQYIAPSNAPLAKELEAKLDKAMGEFSVALKLSPSNEKKLNALLTDIERLVVERKNMY